MLAAMMVLRESIRRKNSGPTNRHHKKKSNAAPKKQSEMLGVIKKGQLRTGRTRLMLFRCDYAGNKNYYYL